MKLFTLNLSMHFKKCQNFQTKNKLKDLVLAKISGIPKYHTSFNFVDGLKLEYQSKSIRLLRGFSVSAQYSSSNSKRRWLNFFKSDAHLGKQPLSKTVPAILHKMCGLML